ncbi:MAG: HAD-IA family hydrolase [Prochlorotrichaceae cyanobacterium]
MENPKVILLDAVGTLFGVRDHVGQVYATIAQEFGVNVEPNLLNRSFLSSFRAAPAMAFPGVDPLDIPKREYEWWQAVTLYTFQQAEALDQFSDFPGFFARLYKHFATARPWLIYPDVLPALKQWRSQGIRLGIVSNFDSRLYPLLDALNLTLFFSSVTISTEVGAAKPDPKIFFTALQKHKCTPEQAWYIGDSQTEDYWGARSVGLRSLLIQRAVG